MFLLFSSHLQMRLKQRPAPQRQTPDASANWGRSVSQIRPARSANAVPSEHLVSCKIRSLKSGW